MEFHPNDLSDLDELTEEHLGFSALSDGLGFSKGKERPSLPVSSPPNPAQTAPIGHRAPSSPEKAKQMALSGIGAVSAGPARPAPSMFAGAKTKQTTQALPTANAAAPAAQVLAEPAAPRSLRILAFLFDSLVIALPLAFAWIFSFREASLEIFLQDPKAPLSLFLVVFGVYFLLSESFGGQSLAKMMLGLRVVEDDKYQKPTGFKHAVSRLGLFLLGIVFLGLGLFASFWDSKRRPWHDRYSGSIVRRQA